MMLPITKSNKLALLYGILLGDGCLSKIEPKYYFISIVGNIKDDYPFLKDVVKTNLKHFVKNKIIIKKRIKQRKLEIQFTNKQFFNKLHEVGFPIGKKGTELSIPHVFNNKNMKHIIQGYFATDGCLVITNNNGIIYPRIELSSISKPLLSQVMIYLKYIGMKGNLYISHKYPSKAWNTLYRIQFNGRTNLQIFIDKIGFINPKHTKKYKNAGLEI